MKIGLNNLPLPADPAYDFPHEVQKSVLPTAGLCTIVVSGFPGTSGDAQLSRDAQHNWYAQPLGTVNLQSTFADNGWAFAIQPGDRTEVFPYVSKP